jgi:hypothetical protein
MSWHKEQQGFLTLAINSQEVDYLKLAYLQALSIKKTQKNNKFAVLVDSNTKKEITSTHESVFDYIIELKESHNGNPYALEPQVFWYSPFKETIKLESDIIFTRSIDHWWNTFRLRDLVLSVGCKNYKQETSNNRKYRKIFDDNHLPDVYNGLMYFRYSATSLNFFNTARLIFDNWDLVKENFKFLDEEYPSTDVVYAICSHIIGREVTTLPEADFINFVHLKPAINNINEESSVKEVLFTEFYNGMLRINNLNQYAPVHYYDKNFNIDEMINDYESI